MRSLFGHVLTGLVLLLPGLVVAQSEQPAVKPSLQVLPVPSSDSLRVSDAAAGKPALQRVGLSTQLLATAQLQQVNADLSQSPDSEHPDSEHPDSEHPDSEHPDSEHPDTQSPAKELVAEPQRDAPPVEITREFIQQRMQVAADSGDETKETKAESSKRFAKALEWLAAADDAAQKAAAYEAEIRQKDELVEQAKKDLATPMPVSETGAQSDAAVSQLEQKASEAEAMLKSARAYLTKREDAIKRRTDRTTELATLLAEAKQRMAELRKQPLAAVAEADLLAESKRAEHDARLVALEKQLLLLQTESRRYEALSDWFPLQRDVAKRQVAFYEKEVGAWQQLVARRRKEESQRQAQEMRRQVEHALPSLRSLAEQNAVLAEMRQTLTAAIESVSTEQQAFEQQSANLKQNFDKITEKVARAGRSSTIGLILCKMRNDLPDRQHCESRQQFIQHEMPRIHLKLIELEEARELLGDIEALTSQIAAEIDSPAVHCGPEYVKDMVFELLQVQRDLLDKLITDHETYLKDLSELELAIHTLVDHTQRAADYVDEHVLWIRSTDVYGVAQLKALGPAVRSLGSPGLWGGMVKQIGADVLSRPTHALLALSLGVIFVVFRQRLLGRLKTVCEGASRHGRLTFLPTLRGLSISVLLSAQWPALMMYVGWHLSGSERATDFSRVFAEALFDAAVCLWLVEFVRQLMRSGGVAETHFNWNTTTLSRMRAQLRVLALAGIPLVFLTTLGLRLNGGEWADSFGRLAFIGEASLLAGFFHVLFYPSGRTFREMQIVNPNGWLIRFRHLVYGVSTCIPFGLATLAAIGYFYSAQQLAVRSQYTLAIMLGLGLAHAVLSRWFLVKRRNLSIDQARQRLAETQEMGAADATQPTVSPQPERDLPAIHEQLRYLLRYAVVGCIVLAGWFVWGDVLPALRVLDQAVLWEKKVEVTEASEDANGNLVNHVAEKVVPTTLRHALLAVLLIVVTYLLGQNLPALMEITVLERLPIDNGGRHAVSMLVRYFVTLTGVFLACRTMGISWASVQWLVAAMTVGLGFGLQEIFANLVSGLIILFERPVRVGDIVTVGNVTGTVSQMRMRATTVTDFDRREMIVPNKKFITDDVINWTLSDPISRVVISVGIAYGSDTALAHSLLMKAARENPTVLTEPEPTALFGGFGESTLDFDLRVFIPNRDVYPVVLHELNTAIDQAFRDANIEIAFPQRDLHVRSLSQIMPVQQEGTRSTLEAA